LSAKGVVSVKKMVAGDWFKGNSVDYSVPFVEGFEIALAKRTVSFFGCDSLDSLR
jgi:hypothetical protein